jgi:hypothetical protein
MTQKLTSLALTILIGVTRAATAQTPPDEPAANPGRPSVSTPATLTPVGYLQLENGILNAFHSGEFETRIGLNQVTKLTIHPRVQLTMSAEPVVWSHDAGQPFEVHAGGVLVGGQVVLRDGEGASPTLAANFLASVYSGGSPDLDLGPANQSVVFLFSNDMGGFHVDANFIVNDEHKNGYRAQHAETLSISHPIGPIGLTGEIWRYSQPLIPGTAVGTLWAVSYAPSKILVLDAGFDRGLTDTSTRWEVFAGFTYLVPHKLWR